MLYMCNWFGRLSRNDAAIKADLATLLTDWFTWSRDERAEVYYRSCLESTFESELLPTIDAD